MSHRHLHAVQGGTTRLHLPMVAGGLPVCDVSLFRETRAFSESASIRLSLLIVFIEAEVNQYQQSPQEEKKITHRGLKQLQQRVMGRLPQFLDKCFTAQTAV